VDREKLREEEVDPYLPFGLLMINSARSMQKYKLSLVIKELLILY